MFIVVLPETKTVVLDGVPKQLENVEFPEGVHSLYFDYEEKSGAYEYLDPTKGLKKATAKNLKPYLEAYEAAPLEESSQLEVADA